MANKFLLIIGVSLLIMSCTQEKTYIKNEGYIFGTTYHFTYESNENLELIIQQELKKFNSSLSTYDQKSIISRINKNDTSVVIDSYFKLCFNKAIEISKITNGAFDMTVAPIVNAWGFGFDESTKADSVKIDSLMQFVGYTKVHLENNKITKENKGTMLDASAIAKGFGVDVAAEVIENAGVKNFMVEIGGEVRARGINSKGDLWRIGIDKPIEDPIAMQRELEDVVSLENKSLATSGNYRQFYEKDGIKYSHTINPKTGFPARNKLLSASVLANNCMTADAFATAFMVMGLEKSIELAESLENIEAYFIYTDSTQIYAIYGTQGFAKMLDK